MQISSPGPRYHRILKIIVQSQNVCVVQHSLHGDSGKFKLLTSKSDTREVVCLFHIRRWLCWSFLSCKEQAFWHFACVLLFQDLDGDPAN